MAKIVPYTVRLRDELAAIQADMTKLLQASHLEPTYVEPNPMQQIDAAFQRRSIEKSIRFSWRKLTPEQEAVQVAIVRRFEGWHQAFNILFHDVGPTQNREIQSAVLRVLSWIRIRAYGSVPPSVHIAIQSFNQALQPHFRLLDVLEKNADPTWVVVPDTNVLIDYQELASYAQALGQARCIVVLPSTVLSELDNSKRDRDKERGK